MVMRKVMTTVVLCLASAGFAQAAGRASIYSSRVLADAPVSRRVAIAPSQATTPATAQALSEGLSEAGFTVVSPQDHPALLVGYVVSQSDQDSPLFPIFSGMAKDNAPAFSAVQGDVHRRLTVVAWRADASEKPTPSSLVWLTTVQSSGLSNDRRAFLPAMFHAGASAYGRTVSQESTAVTQFR